VARGCRAGLGVGLARLDDAAHDDCERRDSSLAKSALQLTPGMEAPAPAHDTRKDTRTRKRLLDVDHVARARLHEAAAAGARPREALCGADLPRVLEVALVARDDADGLDGGAVGAVGGLVVDEGAEGGEACEAGGAGDVVDEQEGVGRERGRRPQRAVLLLPRRVGEREQVRAPVDVARYGVGIFDGGVVAVGGGSLLVAGAC